MLGDIKFFRFGQTQIGTIRIKNTSILEIDQFHITIAQMFAPDSGSPYESA